MDNQLIQWMPPTRAWPGNAHLSPPPTHTWSAGVALMTSSTCQAQPGTNDKASAMCASGDEAPAAASSALKQTNLWV